jgi:MurNAc alpha-1-phosphate uridylyltransferase
MKGMILAAGLGTRLKPFTEIHPKALLPINGKTLLQRNIEYLQLFGIKDVVVNVHHFAGQIKNAVQQNNGWGSNIIISDETDMVLETGGGLKKAATFLEDSSGPFVLMNADMLTDLNIVEVTKLHLQTNVLATLAVTNRNTSRYLLFDENNFLCGWLNEKTGEQKGKPGNKKAFSGIQIISPQIFKHIKEEGKFSMIDLYLRLAAEGFKINGYDHSDGKLLDVGRPESIAIAEKMFP